MARTAAPETFPTPPLLTALMAPAAAIPACSVQPLPAIDDAHALAFEAGVGSPTVVNTQGLTAATARALARFMHIVKSVGGTLTLTSAFRPSPYQQHLQAVWDKWMVDLRKNTDAGCETLKAQVQQEFTRHQLLETQRPAPFSDHTRGTGFDAAIILPLRAHLRRRLSADSLARMAGLRRPDVMRDPVHFRLRG